MSSSMLDIKHEWERITDGPEPETDASYAAFEVFRDMPLHSSNRTERRSYKNIATKIGHKSPTTCADWGSPSKFRWQERARAYDAYKGRNIMAVRDVALDEYKQAIVAQLTQQTSLGSELLNQELARMQESVENGAELDMKRFTQVIMAMKELDSLQRRAAGLPTAYTSEKGDNASSEEQVYYARAEY